MEQMTDFPVMIHEMWPGMSIPTDRLLTFDDGLYSQYLYGRHLPNRKIFFISSNIICDGPQSSEFVTCVEAHQKAFAGNFENYMTIDQIRELHELGCEIGGHSHSHTRLDTFPHLADKVKHIFDDTDQMIDWFETNLGFKPKSFCFPYNEDLDGLYRGLMKKYGFECYGSERINITELIDTPA